MPEHDADIGIGLIELPADAARHQLEFDLRMRALELRQSSASQRIEVVSQKPVCFTREKLSD